jgi:hypothetical protein
VDHVDVVCGTGDICRKIPFRTGRWSRTVLAEKVLDLLLVRLKEMGLMEAGGKQRTDNRPTGCGYRRWLA